MSTAQKSPKIPPLTRKTLQGVWCALILPWNDRDQVDLRRLAQEVRGYGGTGVNGVYTGGTTGEFYAQDDATFAKVAEVVIKEAHALALPVQIGATALSTRTTIQRIRIAKRLGADAFQLALPFWLELKDDEVERYVAEVTAAAGKTPVILYLTTPARWSNSTRSAPPAAMTRPSHWPMQCTATFSKRSSIRSSRRPASGTPPSIASSAWPAAAWSACAASRLTAAGRRST
jgi:hypothetical protein